MAVRVGLEEWAESVTLADNPQEAVVVRLLQEGLHPEEIANLKSMHINAEDRIVYVHRKGGLRPHPISRTCLLLLQQADRQTMCPAHKKDGGASPVKLLMSDFVVKVSLQEYVGNEAFIQDPASVRLRVVYARIRRLTDNGSHAAAASAPSVDLVS